MRLSRVIRTAFPLLVALPCAAQQSDTSPPPPREARYAQLQHVRMYYELYGRDVPGPVRYADLAADTAELLDRLGVRDADFVGWSDGGIIALMLAVRRPDLVRRLVVVGANAVPGREALTPETRAMLASYRPRDDTVRAAEYARLSGDSAGGWAVVIGKLERLWLEHPTPDELTLDDLARIRAPTLVVSGDRDAVRLEHTLELYRRLPDGALLIVPGAEHSVLRDRPGWINPLLRAFLDRTATR